MGLAAAEMAFADAGFDPAAGDPYRQAVITASSSGGNEFGQVEIQKLWGKGPEHVGAYQSIAWFYAATTGQISIKHGMKGHCGVVASEGAGALEALASSRRALRRGMDAVVSGGLEAPIGPYALMLPDAARADEHARSREVPAVRRARVRLSARRGRSRSCCVETAEAALARGASRLRRDRRLRGDARRRARVRRGSARAGDPARAGRRRRGSRRGSTSSSRTARAASSWTLAEARALESRLRHRAKSR